MRRVAPVTIYTVIYDAPESEFGDAIWRFRERSEAESFALGRTHYGAPAEVREEKVPQHVARRWGLA